MADEHRINRLVRPSDGGLVAIGKTASARRSSRVGIWKNVEHFSFTGRGEPGQLTKRNPIMKYSGKTVAAGAGVQLCNPGRLRIKCVHLNGRELRASETNGYYTWRTGCATFTVIAIPKLTRGKHDINLEFE